MDPVLLALALAAAFVWTVARPSTRALSDRRRRALEVLQEVVPSAYGAPGESGARFEKLAPGYKAERVDGKLVLSSHGTKLLDTFTTCGYLPCYLGRGLGLAEEISLCGLEQIRINGKKWGAWVEPGEGREPQPGDPYGIDVAAGGPLIVHVGVFVGKNPDGTWRMADAGQGTREKQEAKYTDRVYDPKTNTLALVIGGKPTLGRKLAGWVDLDMVPALAQAKPVPKMVA
jgi:hypothetical protein